MPAVATEPPVPVHAGNCRIDPLEFHPGILGGVPPVTSRRAVELGYRLPDDAKWGSRQRGRWSAPSSPTLATTESHTGNGARYRTPFGRTPVGTVRPVQGSALAAVQSLSRLPCPLLTQLDSFAGRNPSGSLAPTLPGRTEIRTRLSRISLNHPPPAALRNPGSCYMLYLSSPVPLSLYTYILTYV